MAPTLLDRFGVKGHKIGINFMRIYMYKHWWGASLNNEQKKIHSSGAGFVTPSTHTFFFPVFVCLFVSFLVTWVIKIQWGGGEYKLQELCNVTYYFCTATTTSHTKIIIVQLLRYTCAYIHFNMNPDRGSVQRGTILSMRKTHGGSGTVCKHNLQIESRKMFFTPENGTYHKHIIPGLVDVVIHYTNYI